MRESVSDSGYRHDDISCMTYDNSCRNFTWMCVLCTTVACALRWGVTLVGDYHYWALLTLSWDTPFRYTRRRRSFEAMSMKKAGLWP